MTRNLVLKYGPRLALVAPLAGMAGLARADVYADGVTAITAAQTGALLVVAGIVALLIAIWGAKFVTRFFKS